MSAELIVPQLLASPILQAIIGNRWALEQLPQSTPVPALTFVIVSDHPDSYLSGKKEARPATARVQFNPLAANPAGVVAITSSLATVCDELCDETIAGLRVVRMHYAGNGRYDKDPESGIWTRPVDYLIRYEE